MIYALVDGKPTRPTATGQRAACGCCGGAEMISVCGSQVAWHWRHAVGADCDSWAAGKETPWHFNWKMWLGNGDPTRIEQVIVRDGITHRADVAIPHPDGGVVVIEVQHSWLSQSELTERETFYGRMVWLMDDHGFGKHTFRGVGHIQTKRTFSRPVLLVTEDENGGRFVDLMRPSADVPGVMCVERFPREQVKRAIARAVATPDACAWCAREVERAAAWAARVAAAEAARAEAERAAEAARAEAAARMAATPESPEARDAWQARLDAARARLAAEGGAWAQAAAEVARAAQSGHEAVLRFANRRGWGGVAPIIAVDKSGGP